MRTYDRGPYRRYHHYVCHIEESGAKEESEDHREKDKTGLRYEKPPDLDFVVPMGHLSY